MNTKRPPGLFVAGTDTEIGKTYVAAAIIRQLVAEGLRVGAYKPAASGCRREGERCVAEDAERLWEAAGRPLTLEAVCPQAFLAPLAPHRAAREEGKRVDGELLRRGIEVWNGQCDLVVVEGAGGLMSPISDDDYVADVAFDLGYPVVIVAPNVLGVINQTLQTLITAATFRDGLDIAGIVLNNVRPPTGADASATSNLEEIQQRCVPPVLGTMAWQGQRIEPVVDWRQLAGPPRESEAE